VTVIVSEWLTSNSHFSEPCPYLSVNHSLTTALTNRMMCGVYRQSCHALYVPTMLARTW